jgi:nucleoside diphosphate kinase
MSRMVQARVPDAQYDYLAARAYEDHDGDLSASLRSAIAGGQLFEQIVNSPDPVAALRELMKRSQEDGLRPLELRMDQADEEPDED